MPLTGFGLTSIVLCAPPSNPSLSSSVPSFAPPRTLNVAEGNSLFHQFIGLLDDSLELMRISSSRLRFDAARSWQRARR
jgi:hypothetical protein